MRIPYHGGGTAEPTALRNGLDAAGGSAAGGCVENRAAEFGSTPVFHGYQYRVAGSANAARSGSRTALSPAKKRVKPYGSNAPSETYSLGGLKIEVVIPVGSDPSNAAGNWSRMRAARHP